MSAARRGPLSVHPLRTWGGRCRNVLVATQAELDMVVESNRNWCAHYHAVKEGVTLYAKRS